MITNFINYAKGKASVILKIPAINYLLRGVPRPTLRASEVQGRIGDLLSKPGKFVARLGSNEAAVLAHFIAHRQNAGDGADYPEDLRKRMKNGAGFFPASNAALDRFAELYLEHVNRIDLYAAWSPGDRDLVPAGAAICRIYDLDPFFSTDPWTKVLAGRRVTVVSPFKDTIESQFEQRANLFQSPILPDCTLSVVRAPMTQCDVDTQDQDWFENLARLQQDVAATNPDIVITGCGAYGLAVAGEAAKSSSASAIALGGATQLLFGIIGSRWENDRQYLAIMNKHWVRPGVEERPEGFAKLEIKGGAYW